MKRKMIKTIEYKNKLYGFDGKEVYFRVYDWTDKTGKINYNQKPNNKWLKIHSGTYLKATIWNLFTK